MGLTIHWTLKAPVKTPYSLVEEKIKKIRERCLDLPFEEVGEIIHLQGEECDYQKNTDRKLLWFLIHCSENTQEYVGEKNIIVSVSPKEIIGFSAWPGPGCESMDIFLCKYPRFVKYECTDKSKSIKIPTRKFGWQGQSFCKTQYANDPERGGIYNFLRCHLSVIRILDQANELEILQEVTDESGYWKHRNVEKLIEEIGEWDSMIAAFAGVFKDATDGSLSTIFAPILNRKDFEHLEAKGRNRQDIDDFIKNIAKEIDKITKEEE